MPIRRSLRLGSLVWALWLSLSQLPGAEQESRARRRTHPITIFETSDNCLACHNGLTTTSGEDISIGSDWRASIMANSSRDPYFQASVRRETIDHPKAASDIEDQCALCHMPMARAEASVNGRRGQVFAHLPVGADAPRRDRLAHDGVSCTMCHAITDQKLGTLDSFSGGFVVGPPQSSGPRSIFGPFDIDKGRTTIMRSSSGFEPTAASHVRQSELCATCHTLYVRALGPHAEVIGRLPEQMPYLEWRHSAFHGRKSCQTCHMPVVEGDTLMSSVLGTLRSGVSRHAFRGANSFMLRMLNRYRVELGVEALSQELDASARRTVEHLQSETAVVSVERLAVANGRIDIDVLVQNLAGHKLPTGYPSRRAWLHLTVRDRSGRAVFESGALHQTGSIEGNDNDVDPTRYERHYTEINRGDQVQIYETIIGNADGAVTTGLLTGVRFVKDNRLLPDGFDKGSAEADIAVVGDAQRDPDFTGGGDRIRYSVDLAGGNGPFRIDVELRYQPIGFRWAQNLGQYLAIEPLRFVAYYDSMASTSSEALSRHTTISREAPRRR